MKENVLFGLKSERKTREEEGERGTQSLCLLQIQRLQRWSKSVKFERKLYKSIIEGLNFSLLVVEV